MNDFSNNWEYNHGRDVIVSGSNYPKFYKEIESLPIIGAEDEDFSGATPSPELTYDYYSSWVDDSFNYNLDPRYDIALSYDYFEFDTNFEIQKKVYQRPLFYRSEFLIYRLKLECAIDQPSSSSSSYSGDTIELTLFHGRLTTIDTSASLNTSYFNSDTKYSYTTFENPVRDIFSVYKYRLKLEIVQDVPALGDYAFGHKFNNVSLKNIVLGYTVLG